MSLRFGTDGVRGDTRTVLSAEAVAALGRAGAEVLGANGSRGGPRHSCFESYRWPPQFTGE